MQWYYVYILLEFSYQNKLNLSGFIYMVSPQYESPYAYQDHSSEKMLSHIGCIDMFFSSMSDHMPVKMTLM